MISSRISTLSALVLLVGGALLLCASDVVLPALVPGFPASAAWLGQLVAAGWLGVAALNWLQRRALLGGIYGRPTVLANATLHLVAALSVGRALVDGVAPAAAWAVLVPTALLAVAYGALMLRGPFDPLQAPAR